MIVKRDTEYGFRYDPEQWVKNSFSVQAAMVRKMVFGLPQDGDEEKLETRIEEVLAEQLEDGSFGRNSKDTGGKLLELLEYGASRDLIEVNRAAHAVLRQMRAGQNANEWYEQDGKVLSIYALHALCLLGLKDEPEVPYSLDWLVDHPEEWNDPWAGCPVTPAVFWSALWAGREYAKVGDTIADGLRRVTAEMNEAGCCAYNDPWSFLDSAGQIETTEARALVEKQIPLILRSQHPDGGWGAVSWYVFRALVAHGLFEELKTRSPLPAEWREVREVPLPEGAWFSLTWDGQNFWSFDHQSKEAVAISPSNGSVVHRVGIPNCHAIAWWDGTLAAVGNDPKELKKVNPRNGEVLQTISLERMEAIVDPEVVAGRVLVGDRVMGCVRIIDPEGVDDPHEQCLAGPFPACLAAEGTTVWHADRWASAIIQSDLRGQLLDWGGKPFGIQGLTFDGNTLWALDGEKRRICAIERIKNSSSK